MADSDGAVRGLAHDLFFENLEENLQEEFDKEFNEEIEHVLLYTCTSHFHKQLFELYHMRPIE